MPRRVGCRKSEWERSISSLSVPVSVVDPAEVKVVKRIPRIAILDHTALIGGGEIALLNLARSIDPQRFSQVIILFSDGPLREKLEALQIRTIIFPLDRSIVQTRKDGMGGSTLLRLRDGISAIRFVFRLSKELNSLGINVVHTNSLKSDILGGIAGRLARIPVIWHVRDRVADDYLPKSVATLFRLLARIIPKLVIANSHATLETLRRSGETQTPPRFCVVHDGAEVDPAAVAANHETLIVGLVGRISPWKGQHIFLKAIGLIRDTFPTARFQIIGAALFSEADYEKEIRALSASLQLDDIVDFLGFRDDVASLVDKMDLLVHASTTGEPFGQVILEGMAAGKAVVATRGGGVPEFVDDQINGLLVPMGDAAAMADAMARFLSDETFRLETGQRARQHVIDHFTIQHTASKVQAVYDLALSEQKSGELAT